MQVHVCICDEAADVVRAAGIMCVVPDGRMLFLKRSADTRSHPETWCFPGGKIEPGETPVAAARREMHEEAGTAPMVPADLIDARGGFATYRCLVARPFTVRLNGEHTEAIWAHPKDAPQPLHPGVAATLKHIGAA